MFFIHRTTIELNSLEIRPGLFTEQSKLLQVTRESNLSFQQPEAMYNRCYTVAAPDFETRDTLAVIAVAK
jgi:hypothetical protein